MFHAVLEVLREVQGGPVVRAWGHSVLANVANTAIILIPGRDRRRTLTGNPKLT